MRRHLIVLCLLALALPTTAAAASAGFTGVDTGSYPWVRATVVTKQATKHAPVLKENGRSVVGVEAVNLGRAKSVVFALDRSRSMRGRSFADALTAARRFLARKPKSDRIALVGFGSKASTLTGFSTSTVDARAVLRNLAVDRREGTALHDAILVSADALRGESLEARVIIVLTDGRDVSSTASLEAAIDAARSVGASVYAVAIEGPQFSPAPLKRLARETGGRYTGASSSGELRWIYGSIAAELKRTWQLSYVTSARPGERLELSTLGTKADVVLPGTRVVATAADPVLPEGVFKVGPALMALLVGTCVLGSGFFLLRAPTGNGLRRRILPHVGQQQRKPARERVQERFATASTLLRATENAFGHMRFWHRLHRLLERADVPLRTVEFVYISGGLGLLFGVVLAVGGASSVLILGGLLVGASLPLGFLWFRAKRRLDALENQLPDLLLTLAASLKAGHSFRQGIQAVVNEGQPPASKEFKRVLTETSLGRPMDDALGEMAERVGSENLKFVVTSVTIQRQVGGSLAGIFDMVAEAVRNRQQFARKIKSLTAMGRMSAYVLIGLPFFIAAALTLMNPDYMDPLYHTGTGHMLIGIAATMMVLGTLVLRKIVSFRG